MEFESAIEKGFLNLTDEECDTLLQNIYEIENPETRLTKGLMILGSFIPEKKIVNVLNLTTVILDANDQLEELQSEEGHVHGPECNHN